MILSALRVYAVSPHCRCAAFADVARPVPENPPCHSKAASTYATSPNHIRLFLTPDLLFLGGQRPA